ncbi:hypothetical protein DFH29DRAFT_872807 [Suillus ampliporus]|nr:hypothetical protein DFH29DRAFT_872807 [Suillus ampliporus]
MLERITYGTYLVFGVASFIMVVWVHIFIPETTGYPLEEAVPAQPPPNTSPITCALTFTKMQQALDEARKASDGETSERPDTGVDSTKRSKGVNVNKITNEITIRIRDHLNELFRV